jgi:putrescine transport system ATP-binding protein
MAAIQPPILEITGLCKSFAGTRVLNRINLDVPRGSIVSLLGRSGSGKTTLLQLIAGLHDPDAGRLVIDGTDMTGVPPFARPVNMMFQSYALFPHLCVADNIVYGLKARGVPRAERDRLLAWALELVRLEGLGTRRPDQLSGGQRQRVALARCLVMKPAVLLLDEPMAALDRSLRADVQRELTGIQRRVGTTFVLVTHDQDEAMAISDYIAVMDQGEIVQFGTPRDVYEYPRTKFVASFLGTINLFAGSLAARDGHTVLVTDDGLEINANREIDGGRETNASRQTAGAAGDPGAGATVGVRPEKVSISREAVSGPNHFVGSIEQLSYCGNLSHATIRLSPRRVIEATVVNSDHTGATTFKLGDRVHAAFPAEAAVVLCA